MGGCCGNNKPSPEPGVGRAAGRQAGSKLVYQVVDPVTGEVMLNSDNEPMQYASDASAYSAWLSGGKAGHVQSAWA